MAGFYDLISRAHGGEKILILTVGLPRSGKSTWAKGKSAEMPIVNPDSIRLALYGEAFKIEAEPMVWTLARYMVQALFLAGHQIVILDATNLNPGRREDWRSKDWTTVLKIFDTDVATCKARATAGGHDYLLPVIDRMASMFTSMPPQNDYPVWEYLQ